MKVIAYYLPQFHTIPENDAWWGKGYTEWTSLKNAAPLFPGHNQPRIPLNKNYYDLNDPKVLHWQADLAKKYGVYGFCFYHYWFNGKLLLEKPMENLLNDRNIDIPFCISWANENWTNGWISKQNKILISHDFKNEEDWIEHFEYLLPFLKDERYIKEDGMPILVLYYPNIMTKYNKMMETWNELAKSAGLKGIKFIYQHSRFHFDPSMDKSQFSYGIEFQPGFVQMRNRSQFQKMKIKYMTILSTFLQKKLKLYISKPKTELTKINYEKVWMDVVESKPDQSNMIPGAFVDWDNTPRKKEAGSVFLGGSPEVFKIYFKSLVLKTKSLYKKDTLFIFAWNEWTEGGYLEPDEHFGYGYLEAIYDTLKETNNLPDRNEEFKI